MAHLPKPPKHVAGSINLRAIMRSRSLCIDVMVLRGHMKAVATRKVAHLTFPED